MTDASPTSSIATLRARLPKIFTRPVENAELSELIHIVRSNHPKADAAQIERAYEVAELAHRGQSRKSGDPYITHPLAVAHILAELGIGPAALCAALLHDTIEDTETTAEELEAAFGAVVRDIAVGAQFLIRMRSPSVLSKSFHAQP